jgi:hypothetical protein
VSPLARNRKFESISLQRGVSCEPELRRLSAHARAAEPPSRAEGYDDPAVCTILAHAGAQISATEERDARQGEEYDCKSNQGGMGKEGGKPTPTEDGESEISKSRHNGDKR